MPHALKFIFFFFFNDTATTEIYTLSLHDALPIWPGQSPAAVAVSPTLTRLWLGGQSEEVETDVVNRGHSPPPRSEEHTSELQSRLHLVCRLLLEKKKNKKHT